MLGSATPTAKQKAVGGDKPRLGKTGNRVPARFGPGSGERHYPGRQPAGIDRTAAVYAQDRLPPSHNLAFFAQAFDPDGEIDRIPGFGPACTKFNAEASDFQGIDFAQDGGRGRAEVRYKRGTVNLAHFF